MKKTCLQGQQTMEINEFENEDAAAAIPPLTADDIFGKRAECRVSSVESPIIEDRQQPPVVDDPSVQSFPLEAMPLKLADIIEDAASSFACPHDFLGVPMLVAAAAAIGSTRELQIKPGWREGSRLFAAIVARPGTNKSAPLRFAVSPLHAIQERLEKENDARATDYDDECLKFDARLVAWKRQAEKGPMVAPPRKPEMPARRQIVTTDATMEALALLLRNNPRGLLLAHDELSGWVRAMDQYRAGGKGNDRQQWLSLWSGEPIIINRKLGGTISVPKPTISVVGSIQPAVLRELQGARKCDDGFVDRVLFAYPDPLPARWSAGRNEQTDRAYRTLFDLFWDLPVGAEPIVLEMTPDGHAAFVVAFTVICGELNRGDLSDALRGPWAKFGAYLGRLALVIHMLRWTCGDRVDSMLVDGDSVRAAATLIGYFKSHARRAHGQLQQQAQKTNVLSENEKIERAVARIEKEFGSILVRDFQRSRVAGIDNKDDALSLLRDLERRGRGSFSEDGRRFTLNEPLPSAA
jgi:hypothetical protein